MMVTPRGPGIAEMLSVSGGVMSSDSRFRVPKRLVCINKVGVCLGLVSGGARLWVGHAGSAGQEEGAGSHVHVC